MLVLSRKPDEEIVIADDIRIKILRISGNTVRLGITASADVTIERPERGEQGQNVEFPSCQRKCERERASILLDR